MLSHDFFEVVQSSQRTSEPDWMTDTVINTDQDCTESILKILIGPSCASYM